MQRELLEKNTSADLQVYAVWFTMLPSDQRSRWPAELMSDHRVRHLWDEKKILGRLYAGQLPYPDEVVWDAYLLYGPEARWRSRPPAALSWGSTIVRTRAQFARDLLTLLKGAPVTGP